MRTRSLINLTLLAFLLLSAGCGSTVPPELAPDLILHNAKVITVDPDFRVVEADSGTIGGASSHEFMGLAQTGESEIVHCSQCGYAANTEKAEMRLPAARSGGDQAEPVLERVDTPGMSSVDEVAAHLGVGAGEVVKTLIYESDRG